jgi:hypothetical protein
MNQSDRLKRQSYARDRQTAKRMMNRIESQTNGELPELYWRWYFVYCRLNDFIDAVIAQNEANRWMYSESELVYLDELYETL